ncbi:MAG: GDSL-type esterase/lipase family protein [Lautropia sp.]|nr:GDSL-type esterase/lipase family protein [Lautropia sp.]
MKTTRMTPVIGLVAASLMVAACGGSDDDSSSTPAPNPPAGGAPNTPAPGGNPPATGGNTLDAVKSAMTGTHEAVPAEAGAAYAANGPVVQSATAPAGAVALGGFGQVFTAAGNTAANTRVNVRNIETYVRQAGKWSRIQFSGKVKGAFYSAGYAGAATACDLTAAPNSCLRAEDDGGVSFKPQAGKFFRFWPEAAFSQSLITPAQVEAVFTTAQVRLVKDTAAGADDRANAKFLVNTGATWATEAWATASTADGASGAYNAAFTDVGQGRLAFATNDWKAANFHSATTPAVVDELGVAAAGGVAPIANSQRTDDDDVVNIMFIGDSITQGSVAGTTTGAPRSAQDSFRRNLWNSLMQDASFPMVDFVGTRKGTSPWDVNSCRANSTAEDSGKYKLPEFDTNHFGFWGACVNQVNTALTPALQAMDGDALRMEPDVAIIHLGTNNLNNGQAPAAVIEQLTAQINALRAANDDVDVLVAQVVPFKQAGVEAPSVAQLNTAIAGLSALSSAKSKVVVVNQHQGFSINELYDDFHPTDAGEKLIADKWLAALKANNMLVDAD